MEELRKCPFCGGKAELKMEREEHETMKYPDYPIWCECTKCHASTKKIYPNMNMMKIEGIILKRIESCKTEAIEAWNRRVG